MKSVLVIGGSGLIGRYITDRLRSVAEVTATYGASPFSTEGVETRLCDITDRDGLTALIRETRPDVIVHTAAMRDPDRCEKDPRLAERVNVEAVRRLARLAEGRGAALIYFSTDLVLDGARPMATEADPPNPLNVYGKTKLRGERAALEECTRTLVLRLSLTYGRGHPPHDSFTDWMAGSLAAG